ncbi:S1C family serine protease [Ferroacidibacillus organovorans]|uniref:S1C family serine protease n=1 Tax=Ferroacidibacillus organovorans TaxID=1765683 RepID=UPI00082FD68C|nr:trypsin-like peptidase domain-containing protein [Ferroacidibacillus organovorans]
MGYYDDGEFRSERRARSGAGKWVAVVVVSALIGSGSTLAVGDYLLNNSGALAAATDANLQPVSARAAQTISVNVNDGIVTAVRKVTPAVVGVINMQYAPNAAGTANVLQEAGVGSGVIFDLHGYIVTNNHVVEGATKVEVVLHDGRHVYATVVGTDPYTDLAVLKIPGSDIKPRNVAVFGNSALLEPGDPAIAIGNPAGLDFSDSVTVGVISATQRTMPVQDEATGQVIGEETVLQTDAAINPGNSGGPLCNIDGQIIGINSSKIVAKGFEGMGFSIPINEVRTIATEIVQTGHASHPALGIEGESLAAVPQEYQPNVPVNYGVWVYKVDSNSAKASGIEHGDVIVGINQYKITGFSDLRAVLWDHFKAGDKVQVTYYRGQQKYTSPLVLGQLPPYQPPTASSSIGGGSFVIPNPFSGGGGSGSGSGSGFSFP